MIKIIVLIGIGLFAYYVGLFLWRMLQKSKAPVSESNTEVFHLDIPEPETRRIDVKEEFQKLDEKKNS